MLDFLKMRDIDALDNRDLGLIDWVSPLTGRLLKAYFRASVHGLENVPRGPALYVGNHNMGMMTLDTFIFFTEAYKVLGVDALPYGLAHDLPIRLPGVNQVLTKMGGIRACHENAAKAFAQGKKVVVYPGGDTDAWRPFKHRNKIVFSGRRGYMKLALREKVPIIPFVAAGAQSTTIIVSDNQWLAKALGMDKWLRSKVWPLTLCLPWGVVPGPAPVFLPYPAKIKIEAMKPIRFRRRGPEAAEDLDYVNQCADKVEAAMQKTLTRLAGELKGEKAA
ncbi:1-acyl-sn-glycerol-3-phosphate acyltransferase [Desulfatibacillum alkenivorans DSM 16219]|uniref:1-acyl-sn-glycerol-3-phosphate acyltransferase n=1 Tax=Desulfatibacillum alkenivorans DSM 16219 TaxID=1121393 RepID=A0A1M6GLM4_9BACT|nr:1-acyl-sn-glycerol-3-phosphate acyltransferase [Desulfatibacillum alkenivorans]SHJ10834.1 1-acyl-sn-glycerol-3-phosphate acyltransferase [Desulfatibacillum alkenivorans DSM 16219]